MTVTITHDATERMPPGMAAVKVTTTATQDTYVCPYFSRIIACAGNNESDDDGVGIGVSGSTITIDVATSGDVVVLMIAGEA